MAEWSSFYQSTHFVIENIAKFRLTNNMAVLIKTIHETTTHPSSFHTRENLRLPQ